MEPGSDSQTDAATLVVRRFAGGWRDRFRRYELWVDGAQRAMLRRGESVTLKLAADKHVVQARIAWTGSPLLEIRMAVGEIRVLEVRPAGSARQAASQVLGKDTWLTIKECDQ